jgi:hypothetical protein
MYFPSFSSVHDGQQAVPQTPCMQIVQLIEPTSQAKPGLDVTPPIFRRAFSPPATSSYAVPAGGQTVMRARSPPWVPNGSGSMSVPPRRQVQGMAKLLVTPPNMGVQMRWNTGSHVNSQHVQPQIVVAQTVFASARSGLHAPLDNCSSAFTSVLWTRPTRQQVAVVQSRPSLVLPSYFAAPVLVLKKKPDANVGYISKFQEKVSGTFAPIDSSKRDGDQHEDFAEDLKLSDPETDICDHPCLDTRILLF